MPEALIIDDSASFRASARSLLEAEGFGVNEVGTGVEGIDAVRQRRPELVLLDIQLPDIDGFEVAERLAQLERPPTVILISSRDGADYGTRVSSSPAHGFIAKGDLSRGAVRAILGVQRGR